MILIKIAFADIEDLGVSISSPTTRPALMPLSKPISDVFMLMVRRRSFERQKH